MLAGGAPDAVLALCKEIASATIAGLLPDPTHGANHYYAISMPNPPSWSIGAPCLAVLGRQRFYNVP